MLPTEHVPVKVTSQLLSLNGKEMTTELKGNIDCSLKTYSKQPTIQSALQNGHLQYMKDKYKHNRNARR